MSRPNKGNGAAGTGSRSANSALAERIKPQSVVREVEFSPPDATPTSSKYRIIVTDEMDAYDTPMPPDAMFDTSPELMDVIGDDYSGTARKAAKLSIAQAQMEDLADLKDLIATLPSISAMVNHNPKIGKGASSWRVVEERRNVRLRVWLYAASREADNDFHLILGRAPGLAPEKFMTMELSGLPPANGANFAKLKAARDAFKQFFGNHLPGGTYQFYDPPIPVEIEGSLFFDITHATGPRPGPSTLRDRMPTIWEVHPISKIVFEP